MFKSLFDSIRERVFGRKPEVAPAVAEAPYKVEPQPPVVEPSPVTVVAPEPAKCGCGRSPTGFCVGLHKLTQEEWAVHADNPAKPAPAPKRARAQGKFKGDDKLTVETNEAWEGGKAPAKKPKKPRNEPAKLKVVTADAAPKKKYTKKK